MSIETLYGHLNTIRKRPAHLIRRGPQFFGRSEESELCAKGMMA